MFGKGGLTQTVHDQITLRFGNKTASLHVSYLKEHFLEKRMGYVRRSNRIRGNVLPCTKHSITTWFIDCSYTHIMLPSYVSKGRLSYYTSSNQHQHLQGVPRCRHTCICLFISPCSKVHLLHHATAVIHQGHCTLTPQPTTCLHYNSSLAIYHLLTCPPGQPSPAFTYVHEFCEIC